MAKPISLGFDTIRSHGHCLFVYSCFGSTYLTSTTAINCGPGGRGISFTHTPHPSMAGYRQPTQNREKLGLELEYR
jgi:hypothetical protein